MSLSTRSLGILESVASELEGKTVLETPYVSQEVIVASLRQHTALLKQVMKNLTELQDSNRFFRRNIDSLATSVKEVETKMSHMGLDALDEDPLEAEAASSIASYGSYTAGSDAGSIGAADSIDADLHEASGLAALAEGEALAAGMPVSAGSGAARAAAAAAGGMGAPPAGASAADSVRSLPAMGRRRLGEIGRSGSSFRRGMTGRNALKNMRDNIRDLEAAVEEHRIELTRDNDRMKVIMEWRTQMELQLEEMRAWQMAHKAELARVDGPYTISARNVMYSPSETVAHVLDSQLSELMRDYKLRVKKEAEEARAAAKPVFKMSLAEVRTQVKRMDGELQAARGDVRRLQQSVDVKMDAREVLDHIEGKYEDIIDHLHQAIEAANEDEEEFRRVATELQDMVKRLMSNKADKADLMEMKERLLLDAHLREQVESLRSFLDDKMNKEEVLSMIESKPERAELVTRLKKMASGLQNSLRRQLAELEAEKPWASKGSKGAKATAAHPAMCLSCSRPFKNFKSKPFEPPPGEPAELVYGGGFAFRPPEGAARPKGLPRIDPVAPSAASGRLVRGVDGRFYVGEGSGGRSSADGDADDDDDDDDDDDSPLPTRRGRPVTAPERGTRVRGRPPRLTPLRPETTMHASLSAAASASAAGGRGGGGRGGGGGGRGGGGGGGGSVELALVTGSPLATRGLSKTASLPGPIPVSAAPRAAASATPASAKRLPYGGDLSTAAATAAIAAAPSSPLGWSVASDGSFGTVTTPARAGGRTAASRSVRRGRPPPSPAAPSPAADFMHVTSLSKSKPKA